MNLSTLILPIERWPRSREKWLRAEELGFFAAYTYDHLSWPRLIDRPWFAAVPTLTAAALETSTMRLGTMVTNPNFHHPVPLAKDLLSIDDVSSGRLTVGIGAGTAENDATVLGAGTWSGRERMDRFGNFVDLLDELLREPLTSREGPFYSAHEACMLPGTLQRPRPPFCIAARGRRGLAVAARHAQAWVATISSAKAVSSAETAESCHEAVASQMRALDGALDEAGRARDSVARVLLNGLNDETPLASLDAFVDWAGRYQALGITELVLHWPEPGTVFDWPMKTFETIATEGLAQL
jgi:alkanesulfonate monooxygenase SsuD/methylene tetrahydromethanopterin reductase-like flavin-dependent oxidoreductase (luciferase family)